MRVSELSLQPGKGIAPHGGGWFGTDGTKGISGRGQNASD